MSISISPQASNALSVILKPYEKNLPGQFIKLLSQITYEKEKNFLCILSIMIQAPNSMNHSLIYLNNKINNQEDNINSKLRSKSPKQKIPKTEEPKNKTKLDLKIYSPKDIPLKLPNDYIISFWVLFAIFCRQKKESSIAVHASSFIDLIPKFYSERILDSLLSIRSGSFLVIEYIRKVQNDKMHEFSEKIIKTCSNDQIRLFIPFIVSSESSSEIIESWVEKHINQIDEDSSNYELALSYSLSSYQCIQLQPTTIDLIVINFLNGRFSTNSDLFESFVYYIHRNVRQIDRRRFSTNEDFLMTFFSVFSVIRPNLFNKNIVCPNMFTKMIKNNIKIPPFSLSLFFRHLNDDLLKYLAKQFIINKNYINYIKKCYEKSIRTNKNSYSRKILDYAIMALFLKTPPTDKLSYPIVIKMIPMIKLPREEFAYFVFVQIAKMFSNPNSQDTSLSIVENWKQDDMSMIVKFLLTIFRKNNINALNSVEKIICKRGGHAITALYCLSSTPEFCADKSRKALLIKIIKRIVANINIPRLRPQSYMPKKLYEFIAANIDKKKPSGVPNELSSETENDPPQRPINVPRSKSRTVPNNKAHPSKMISPLAKEQSKESLNNPETKTKTRSKKSSSNQVPHSSNPKVKEFDGCKLTKSQIESFLLFQIYSNKPIKIDTSKVAREIISFIDLLDRKHSNYNPNKTHHANEKPQSARKPTKDKIKPKEEETQKKKVEKEETPKEKPMKKEETPKQKEEVAIDVKDEEEESNHSNDAKEEEISKDEDIPLNDDVQNNKSPGIYNVVGSVMKMLFGFRKSSANSETESGQNYRASLPPSAFANNNEMPKLLNENDNCRNDDNANNFQQVKTEPLFEEIDISSGEGEMAFPDQSYSSSSKDGYSDSDLSNFDIEISDNEMLVS